ncbi:DUF3560 domain-containing protein [uncultured Desulfovibrio sp.]|uniref:DUF3560 domain-containing protein n=1 Tax=uncultured Desulfovibrio sp. TaxID=167968 RepID=UPI00258BFC8C|nr:DUF3560 domain-containing protein [uncultured Desulfovibrio sp.]
MNDYEAKLEARRERYEEKAEQLRAEAKRLHQRAHEMADVIPFGQPILVGHYSEGRDRRYRERIHNTFGKAFATMDKANHYEQKAASVGTGGISSDDPDAVVKLKEKLESLQRNHEWMKNVNAAIRKGKTPDKQIPALVALGMTEAEAQELLKPDYCGRIGIAPYSLQNNNANIRRVEQRIRELERAAERNVTVEREGNGYTYREDADENRVMFLFDGKPEEATRKLLKAYGFKWSPTRTAWVRMLNNAGRYAATCVRRELEKTE